MPNAAVREAGVSGGGADPDDSGRIPFRIRVGVTGHRWELPAEVKDKVNEQLGQLQRRFAPRSAGSANDVRLAVISQLANGADRLVADCGLDYAKKSGYTARLEVVLPFQRDEYVRRQKFGDESRRHFDRLMEQAAFCSEPDECLVTKDGDSADAYTTANKKVIRRCDVLIAIWDGEPANGRGGTGHTLLMAAAQGKPCIWIRADGKDVVDNLEPKRSEKFFSQVKDGADLEAEYRPSPRVSEWSLQPLQDDFRAFEDYNAEPRPSQRHASIRDRVAEIAARVIDSVTDRKFVARFDTRVRSSASHEGTLPPIAPPLARASLLATHYRREFMALAAATLVCAGLAACVLAIGAEAGHDSPLWPALELTLLVLAAAGFLLVRELRLHGRWLSYRVLAERLRTARYIAPVGFDFRAYAEFQGGWSENPRRNGSRAPWRRSGIGSHAPRIFPPGSWRALNTRWPRTGSRYKSIITLTPSENTSEWRGCFRSSWA